MKAFYVDRTELDEGHAVYSVWDYFTKRKICVMTMPNDKTNEMYADTIAKLLNELMHSEDKL